MLEYQLFHITPKLSRPQSGVEWILWKNGAQRLPQKARSFASRLEIFGQVSKKTSPQASHREVREPLDSYKNSVIMGRQYLTPHRKNALTDDDSLAE